MRALNTAAAEFELAIRDPIHLEQVPADCRTDHIHNRINRTHLVKMDPLRINAVDLTFGFREHVEATDRILFDRLFETTRGNRSADLGKGAVRMVTVIVAMRFV